MLLLNDCYKTISGHFFAIYMFIFHKHEVQMVILICSAGLNFNWFKSYDLKGSMRPSWSIDHILEHEFFCLGRLGCPSSKEKKVDLSFYEQLLRVVFSAFCGQKKLNLKKKYLVSALKSCIKRLL